MHVEGSTTKFFSEGIVQRKNKFVCSSLSIWLIQLIERLDTGMIMIVIYILENSWEFMIVFVPTVICAYSMNYSSTTLPWARALFQNGGYLESVRIAIL